MLDCVFVVTGGCWWVRLSDLLFGLAACWFCFRWFIVGLVWFCGFACG